jgi:hypothetical protein
MFCTSLLALAALTTTDISNNGPGASKFDAKVSISKEKDVGDITGYYACSGQEGLGKQYSGVAVIMKKNDIYLIQWTVGIGGSYYGVAIRQGDTLAASWALPGEKGVVRGVNLYRIEPGPRLTGRWAAIPGDGSMRTETLTFLKRMEED